MSDASIMKDGEDSIPIGTAISRWAKRAFKAEDEIDLLRAEVKELLNRQGGVMGNLQQSAWSEGYRQAVSELKPELDRLRAENAELKTVIHASCTTESAAENNRIRAENSVLRKYARHRSTCSLALGLYETCSCGFDAISAPPGKEE